MVDTDKRCPHVPFVGIQEPKLHEIAPDCREFILSMIDEKKNNFQQVLDIIFSLKERLDFLSKYNAIFIDPGCNEWRYGLIKHHINFTIKEIFEQEAPPGVTSHDTYNAHLLKIWPCFSPLQLTCYTKAPVHLLFSQIKDELFLFNIDLVISIAKVVFSALFSILLAPVALTGAVLLGPAIASELAFLAFLDGSFLFFPLLALDRTKPIVYEYSLFDHHRKDPILKGTFLAQSLCCGDFDFNTITDLRNAPAIGYFFLLIGAFYAMISAIILSSLPKIPFHPNKPCALATDINQTNITISRLYWCHSALAWMPIPLAPILLPTAPFILAFSLAAGRNLLSSAVALLSLIIRSLILLIKMPFDHCVLQAENKRLISQPQLNFNKIPIDQVGPLSMMTQSLFRAYENRKSTCVVTVPESSLIPCAVSSEDSARQAGSRYVVTG